MSTRATIKGNFETGDTPTQAQFADWIDSDFNLDDDTSDEITEGTTNVFLKTTQQNIDGDKDFQDEISVSKRSKSGINSIAYAASVSVDFAAGDVHEISTVTGNLTVNTTNIENGQTGAITFTINATGGYTIASGTGTWKKYDDSAYDFADCNVASTEYHVFYFIRNSTIYYNIQAVSP